MKMTRKLASCAVAVFATLVLAGCGGSAPVLEEGSFRGVYVSTGDCAQDPNMTFEICADAIRTAIDTHATTSPTYETMRACTASEGAENCERNIEQKYRPRLKAYLVQTFKEKPPMGSPLYSKADNSEGFRDLSQVVYLQSDLTIQFSKDAVHVYAQNLTATQRSKLF